MYIELHTSSAFSFLRAASLPETLIERAASLGYPAVALLDRDGVSGAPRFHKAALAAGLRPLIGAELTIQKTQGTRHKAQDARLLRGSENSALCLVPSAFTLPVLVSSQQGWQNLCRLISRMKLRAPKGEGALTLEDLETGTAGLVALAGSQLLRADRHGVGGLLDRLVGIFGRSQVYVELQRHLRRDQEDDNETLVCLADAFRVPVVATGGVTFATPEERPLFDVLTSIREHIPLDRAGRRLAVNAERYLKSPAQMARLFADHPGAVQAAADLADRLQFSMRDLGYRFPRYPVPPGETEASFLRKMAEVGARNRYRPFHDRARAQIARELDLIEKLDLAGYFLIVWDIVNFCRQQDILVQGRGSAANSAVCYSLGITAVDPVGMELLFERFLSEERGEWPDIDLDLPSGDRRERVIQHVYEKYGRHGAAMTANVITYRGRSAAREVGKALSLDEMHIDRLAKVMHQFEFVDPDDTLSRRLAEVGMTGDDGRVRQFAALWRQMQDLPRHLGQHSGGMVVCQGALSSVVPLENASMPGRVIVQWDKEDCADMGIIKVDLLGLGMMAVLQDSIRLINSGGSAGCMVQGAQVQGAECWVQGAECSVPCADDATPSHLAPSHPVPLHPAPSHPAPSHPAPLHPAPLHPAPLHPALDLAHLPPDDPAVYRMLQAADTIGVFQVESRAQMATLPRLKPTCFYDLVVEVALIRPGPIVGQMVHPYLDRRAGREPVTYDHPLLVPILKRTLGVPLFQEQLLRMAMAVAGFTGGQAEDLRRAMGFKRSEKRMAQLEGLLREGMAKNGITGETADRIVRSITSFALYGFPESHAASFALIAYASAYLKVHYPAAFFTALLNNQPMGFYHPATLVKDAQRRGVRFAPIDVQVSDWDCTVEADGTVRLGLRYVRGLREDTGRTIEKAEGTGQKAEGRRQKAEGISACPKCGCDDPTMIEEGQGGRHRFCNVCSHQWTPAPGASRAPRFRSIDDLVGRIGLRRDELAVLAEVGALNALGHDRRSALWQIERAVRPAGELFENTDDVVRGAKVQSAECMVQGAGCMVHGAGCRVQSAECRVQSANPDAWRAEHSAAAHPAPLHSAPLHSAPLHSAPLHSAPLHPAPLHPAPLHPAPLHPAPPLSPLTSMTVSERLVADYAGTGLTVGPHPLTFRRHELAMRGVLRAIDLPRARAGRRVRTAGMVITRQRPGTAKGFVFLTLEDETGIANIIVRPDLYASDRLTIVESSFLLVEGVLQNQDGVTAVRAERVARIEGLSAEAAIESHDFH